MAEAEGGPAGVVAVPGTETFSPLNAEF